MKTFTEVADEALEEAREKFVRYWRKADPDTLDAVNFALGLFSGIVLRRMKGEPDPEPEKRENAEAER